MRILVIGAGAIGLWLSAKLAQSDHEVTLVARERTAGALVTTGIRLVSAGEVTSVRNFTLATGIEEALEAKNGYDLACLTMKAYDVGGAVKELVKGELPAQVICFQNGLGSEETAAAQLGPDRIIAGTITTPVSILGPATIEPGRSKRRGVGLALFQPERYVNTGTIPPLHSLTQIASTFRQAGLMVRTYPDYRAMLWSKLLLNMLGNATSAILDMSPADVYSHRELFRLEHQAVCEALTVMHVLNIGLVDLPGVASRHVWWWLVRLPDWVLQPALQRVVAGGRSGKMPSLRLDLASGKSQTEVGYLNGAVVRHGRPLGVATPTNQVLTNVLERLAQGTLDWDEFRFHPERLLAELKTV